jgi:glycosyltransferase involved in cell wall biosynthesis
LQEALSNSLMEAMACGCCPIASRVGGNPELVDDGVRGLLFVPGDSADLTRKLNRLVEDAQLRRDMAIAASHFIHSNFSRASSTNSMITVYQQLLCREQHPGPFD